MNFKFLTVVVLLLSMGSLSVNSNAAIYTAEYNSSVGDPILNTSYTMGGSLSAYYDKASFFMRALSKVGGVAATSLASINTYDCEGYCNLKVIAGASTSYNYSFDSLSDISSLGITSVPIYVTYALKTSSAYDVNTFSGNETSATASFFGSTYGIRKRDFNGEVSKSGTVAMDVDFDRMLGVTVSTNTISQITASNTDIPISAHAFAFADPTVIIDPDWEYASLFSVTETFDPTVYTGEVSHVVPIPAAAWLFGSGLIGLVGVARRKKA